MGARMPAKKHLKTTREASAIIKQYYANQKKEQEGGKKIAWCGVGVPRSILRAMGVVGLYPEQYATVVASRGASERFVGPSEEMGFAKELCGYARVNFGFIMEGLPPDAPMGGMARPDFLIITTIVCDTRVKWFELMGEMLNVPVHLMEIPYLPDSVSPETAKYVAEYSAAQYQELIAFLEEMTGNKLDLKKLQEIQEKSGGVSLLRAEIDEYRKAVPCPMGSADAFTAMFPGMYMPGTKIADEFYKNLRTEVKERMEKKIGIVPEEKFRLLWNGIPFWYNMGLITYFEDFGGVVVMDTTYYGGRYKRFRSGEEELETREGYQTAGQRGIAADISKVMTACEEYSIDGVILSYTPTCRPFYVHQLEIKNALMDEMNIPSLLLEADMADPASYNDADVQQRIDAFIELMLSREKNR